MKPVIAVCSVVITLAIVAGVAVYAWSTHDSAERQERKRQAAIEECVEEGMIPTYITTPGGSRVSMGDPTESKVRRRCEERNP